MYIYIHIYIYIYIYIYISVPDIFSDRLSSRIYQEFFWPWEKLIS